MDPVKIRAIEDWPTPWNVMEVRSSMGLVGYYRIFIESFSRIKNPIASLQQKGVKFTWNHKCEDNFRLLKCFLTRVLVLKLLDSDKDYVA